MGCFWKPEEKFKIQKGILDTEVGYIGGITNEPTYHDVCSGETGHAEAVRVKFDQDIVSYEELVSLFFEMHNPTTLNRQGLDIGTQYRSEIFCLDDDQYLIADAMKRKFNKEIYSDKIVTSISMAENFWIAEEYHQKYVRKKKNMIF